MTYYLETKTIRETANKRFVAYRFWESFGRDTSYARSWGNREKRGTGKIWLLKNETLEDGIARRNRELV